MSPGQVGVLAQQAEVEGHLRKQVMELERDLARVTGERNIMKEIKERFEADATAAQGERNEQRAEPERLLAQGKFLEERLASVQQDLEAARRESGLLRQGKEQSDRLAEQRRGPRRRRTPRAWS